MKSLQKRITSWNNHKIFILYPDKHWVIDIIVDVSMSAQELNTYLSYRVAETTNEKTLFFYIKQKNSYLVFIAKKSYIENLIKKYPKTIISPLPIAYDALIDDDSWVVFNINEDSAFVVTNINKKLKTSPLPLLENHTHLDKNEIVKTIVSFINNMMPHIDELGVVKNIYFDGRVDILQEIDGKSVYGGIKINKLDTSTFNPSKLFFNFAKIKFFRFYFLIGLFVVVIGGFFVVKTYLEIANEKLMQKIQIQNEQFKSINNKMQTIKDIQEQINIIHSNNNKTIVPNSDFSNRLIKVLSSQNKIIKIISMDVNKSHVK